MNTRAFSNPPIVELVLGVQFERLGKLTSAHLGRYWQQLAAEWPEVSDAQPIEEVFETFGEEERLGPRVLRLGLAPVAFPGRLIVTHRDRTRVLQLQATRLHLNWRKYEQVYPSYDRLVGEFEKQFQRFGEFVRTSGLGELKLNQWELTYVDAFFQGEDWESAGDWQAILPGLFGSLPPLANSQGVAERCDVSCTYRLSHDRGRLHVCAKPGSVAWDKRPALLLRTTARGPLRESDMRSLRAGLDFGHRAALDAFLAFTADQLKKKWREGHGHGKSADR